MLGITGAIKESVVHACRLSNLVSVLSVVSFVVRSNAKTTCGVGRNHPRMPSTCASIIYSYDLCKDVKLYKMCREFKITYFPV